MHNDLQPRFSPRSAVFGAAFSPTAAAGRALLRGAPLAATLLLVASAAAGAQSLRGSIASLDLQNRIAAQHDFTYLVDGARVRRFAEQGLLVRIEASRDLGLKGVSYPYARPEVALFVQRLGSQYRAACGEQLVITSLTRPTSGQPANASDRSVHPTGMALDLRRPNTPRCRSWLESVLLGLERSGVLDVTLERFPVHYHVAVFPRQYAAYVQAIQVRSGSPAVTAVAASSETATALAEKIEYKVRRGDSLWTIARTHGTTVDELRARNQLDGSRIYVGQVLDVPLGD